MTEAQMAAARARLDAKANRTMRSGGKKEKKKGPGGPGSPTKKAGAGKGKPMRLGAQKLSKAELAALDRTKEGEEGPTEAQLEERYRYAEEKRRGE